MAKKEYMIGTLDDAPMQMVTLNGKKYLVDVKEGEVFLDETGIPRVKDEATIVAVLEAAK